MRRKQRIQDVAESVVMERGPREPRLQPGQHAPLFQPLPHFVEGMIAIENRAP
jgi:hypothetical protein